jgi:selenocysteine-specific elongation factor
VTALLDGPDAPVGVRSIGPLVVSTEALSRGCDRLLAAVSAFHTASPMSEGMPREALRTQATPAASAPVFDALMAMLVRKGTLIDRERVARRDFRVAVPGGEDALARIEAAYVEAGLTPPEGPALAETLGLPATSVATAVAYLVRQKRLVKVDPLVMHPSAVDRLKKDVAAMKQAGGSAPVTLDVAAIKERYGISRKFAIPLLEFLDRERVTRRVGEHRVLL